MNVIKHLRSKSEKYTLITLNDVKYRGYPIGELPSKFGCIDYGESGGIDAWVKIPGSGLTYINDRYFA